MRAVRVMSVTINPALRDTGGKHAEPEAREAKRGKWIRVTGEEYTLTYKGTRELCWQNLVAHYAPPIEGEPGFVSGTPKGEPR